MKRCFSRATALAVLLLACFGFPAAATTFTARVIAISDGDTLTVLDTDHTQHKIRLAGIDAPEKQQAWGQRARQALAGLVFNRIVQIKVDKTDRYGREIGKVLLDGADVNLELVRLGLAWHYKAYEREQSAADRRLYAQAERLARDQRQGLWVEVQPQAPWDYRRQGRR